MIGMDKDLWDVADSLGTTLNLKGERFLPSKETFEVKLGDLVLPVPFRIVDGIATRNGLLVLCQTIGNLALLATTREFEPGTAVSIHVLNIIKMKTRPENLLPRVAPAKLSDVVDPLVEQGALVATFRKTSKAWVQQGV